MAKDLLNDRLKQAARQIAGKTRSDDELIPEVAIKGIGHIMCYDPSKKQFIKINRGVKAYVIDGKLNASRRVLIYTFGKDLVEIEPKELINIGFD